VPVRLSENPQPRPHSKGFLTENLTPISKEPTAVQRLDGRGWFGRADSTPFAIISIKLSTVNDAGHPPRIVEYYVSTYFGGTQIAGTFEYYEFSFSLDNDAAEEECVDRAMRLAHELRL
jgi:hypothetical protein